MAKSVPQITKYQLVQIDTLTPIMDPTEVLGESHTVPLRFDTREEAEKALSKYTKKEQKNLTVSEVKVDA